MAAALRIFSYLPNPRVAKAVIAGRLCGVEIEVRGAPMRELSGWLWDYEARPLADGERDSLAQLARGAKTGFSSRLYKTEAFLEAHPFGTVPAAFGPDGKVGIFESNSILRAVARLGDQRVGLYGRDPWEASRIDSFLDLGLLFGREVQRYVLALRAGSLDRAGHVAMHEAANTWLGGIERALAHHAHIAGAALSLADIASTAELALLHNERNYLAQLSALGVAAVLDAALAEHPATCAHFTRLLAQPAFAAELAAYVRDPPLR